MQADLPPPAAIDCLRRGLWSLRANWELVPTVVVQSVIATVLVLAGAVPPCLALGVGSRAWLDGLGPDWPYRLSEELAAGLAKAPDALAPLVLALLATTLLWSLAFLVYCYVQGGVVGILVRGDRRAGSEAEPGALRAFSLAALHQLGKRFLWRYFWLYNLVALLLLLWTLPLLALAVLTLRAAEAGPGAAVAVGCGGLLPLAFLLLVLILWGTLATADLARERSGVWTASRVALRTLGRRLGAALLLWLLAVVAWTALGMVFAPLSWGIALGAGGRWLVWLTARGLLAVAESLANGAVAVALLAALVTLVRGRRAEAVA